MKRNLFIIGLILIVIMALSACTDNQMAKNFGGSMTVEVAPDRKLVNLTWKDDELWVLERQRKAGEQPDTYMFEEHSSFGVIQGKVVIVEK